MTRKEAIHIIDVAFDIPQAVRRADENRTYFEDEVREAKAMAIKALEEPRWIPVSKKLPDCVFDNTVSEDVLVFDGADIRVGEYRKAKYLNGGYWRVYGYDDLDISIIAWMPLPKPYEEEEE